MLPRAESEFVETTVTAKRFKACRTCKRQKMRCEGPERAPCKRCQTAQTECIFDLIDDAKRQQKRQIEDDLMRSYKFRSLEHEIKELRGAVQTLKRIAVQPTPGDDTPHEARRVRRRTNSAGRNHEVLPVVVSEPGVHSKRDIYGTSIAISPNSDGIIGTQTQSHLSSAILSLTDAPLSPRHTLLSGALSPLPSDSNQSPEDLITRGLIPISLARELFERFQARCNPYLPLFDPLVDTFESIRSRSRFCFTAILAIASRLHGPDQTGQLSIQEVCQSEAQTLAAKTLFDDDPQLETVQGMVLVGAYSQKCWYAIGHAVRLAQRMRLGDSLSQLIVLLQGNPQHSGSLTLERETRVERTRLMRQVRVWMTLAHIEQEIASGLGRDSLIERNKQLNVRQLIEDPIYPVSSYHTLAAIELLRHRDKFRSQLKSTHGDNEEWFPAEIPHISDVLGECFNFWDSALADVGCPRDASQRAYLVLQRNFAEIDTHCAVLDCALYPSDLQESVAYEETTLRRLLSYAERQLSFVLETNPYHSWQFQSIPVYSCLAIASTTVLALRVLSKTPTLEQSASIVSLASRIRQLLSVYPFANYQKLVDSITTAIEPGGTVPGSNGNGPSQQPQCSEGAVLDTDPGVAGDEAELLRELSKPSATGDETTMPASSEQRDVEDNRASTAHSGPLTDWAFPSYLSIDAVDPIFDIEGLSPLWPPTTDGTPLHFAESLQPD